MSSFRCQQRHSQPRPFTFSREAFTIIELMVVISIISLLVALLLPALGKARESARTSLCLSNVKQLMLVNHLYADASKEWLTPWITYDPLWVSGETKFGMFRRLERLSLIAPVKQTDKRASSGRYCPSLVDQGPTPQAGWENHGHYAMDYSVTGFSNYSLNAVYVPHRKRSDIRKPSSIYAVADSVYIISGNANTNYTFAIYNDTLNVGTGDVNNNTNRRWRPGANLLSGAPTSAPATQWRQSYRHSDSNVNFGFLDGHASTIKYDSGVNGWGLIFLPDHQN